MAGKLSEIRASSPAAAITGTELIEVTQSGATKAATVAEILGAQSLDGLSDVAVTGAAQGAILYRAAAGWVHLPAGTAGQVLTTAGAGANPAWAAVAQRIGINNQTGTAYTAVLSDAGKMLRCSNASAVALTLPTGTYTVGDVIMVRQVGAGQITASGGTINGPTGVNAKTRAQGSVMSLHYVAADTWDVSGDLA